MTQKTPASDGAVESRTSCTCVTRGGRFVITVAGELDLAAVEQGPLATAVSSYRCDEPLDVVLDLRNVTFLDSAGLSWLMAVRSAAALANRRVRLRASSPSVDKTLERAQLHRYFPAESRVAHAVAAARD